LLSFFDQIGLPKIECKETKLLLSPMQSNQCLGNIYTVTCIRWETLFLVSLRCLALGLGASCATPERSFISSWARWTQLSLRLRTQLQLARSRLRPPIFFSLSVVVISFCLSILFNLIRFKGKHHSHAAHWRGRSEAQAAATPPPRTAKTFSPSKTEHGHWERSAVETAEGIDARTTNSHFHHFSLLPGLNCEYFFPHPSNYN
jgi:hypothetical protein